MKNINKYIGLFIVMMVIIFINFTNVWADPNSSKGFADFSDEEAEIKSKEQIKEQESEHNITEIKSSDNYLSNLEVEGYTLIPEFDKQTLEYTIKEKVKENSINIKANVSNEKSTVKSSGSEKKENDNNECKVEVIAENGTVRTYTIKYNSEVADKIQINVKKEKIQQTEQDEIKQEENQEKQEENQVHEEKHEENAIEDKNQESAIQTVNEEDKSSETKNNIIIGGIIIVSVITLIVAIVKTRKRAKH